MSKPIDIVNVMATNGNADIARLNRTLTTVAEAAAVKRSPRTRTTPSEAWLRMANSTDNTLYQDVTDNFM